MVQSATMMDADGGKSGRFVKNGQLKGLSPQKIGHPTDYFTSTWHRANTNITLKEVTRKFSPELVTHVDWPCKICNNNRPAHNDPGERSSQYAAEASCRSRFGPLTDWMAFMGKTFL